MILAIYQNRFFFKLKYKIIALLLYKYQFKEFGKKSRIDAPLKIEGKKYIEIGNRVLINYKTWLACMPLSGEKNPILKIGNKCTIGNFNHIYSTGKIIIEDYVLTADKVFIADNIHEYEDIHRPVIDQPIKQTQPVTIGEGSWLGENVVVAGASVGKHCVIGANAVVTKDIPNYSVAVGIPAKVIKQYNFETQQWEKTVEK